MIKINLLPPEYEQVQARREQKVIFGLGGVVLAVVLLGFYAIEAKKAAALGAKISEAENDLKKYQAIVSQIDQIEADKKRLSAKRDVIRNLNRSRLVYPVFFEDLLPIIPSDIWISNVQITEMGQGQMKVVMASNALSNFALATWLTNLQQSTHFSGIDLSPISYAKTETGSTLSFVLTCVYQHKGPFPLSDAN